jgi:hypothetical protein
MKLACGAAFVMAMACPAQTVTPGRPFSWREPSLTDLSGLTWVAGERYAAVSDQEKAIIPLLISIDPNTGEIRRIERQASLRTTGSQGNFEAIAWHAPSRSYVVSGEERATLLRCAADGTFLGETPMPSVFERARRNLGLESLTYNATTQRFWTGNEEALVGDGPVAARGVGTTVRLQELSADLRPLRQFAWTTEAPAFRVSNVGNGVSDLCALPDGRLLVLERGFGLGGLWCRLFIADFAKATNIASQASLADASFVSCRKTLVFTRSTGFTNYEAMTFGPPLANGDRMLLLMADSNGGARHAVLPLRFSGFTPQAPAPPRRASRDALRKP